MNKQHLQLKQSQQLALTPQLQHAIELLGMNRLELEQELNQILNHNFMLNIDSPYQLTTTDEPNDFDEQIDYDPYNDPENDWQEPNPSYDPQELLEQQLHTPTLSEHLIEQLHTLSNDPTLLNAATIIAYNLDSDGYFRDTLKAIAQSANLPISQLKQGLELIRQCQPTGVGATDLQDCLTLQLQQLPTDTPHLNTLKHLIARYLPYIGKNPQLIKKNLNISEEEYQHALKLLRKLDPQPGQHYTPTDLPIQYQAEIIVLEKNGISYIETTEELLPKLSLNKEYAQLLKQSKGQNKTLLNAQFQEAKFILNALQKRADTIRRVASAIVAQQQEFFQQGDSAMKPLTRQQIAQRLDLHESTISRAINGKYLQCKQGLYELRYFFANEIENSDGDNLSITAIKARIQQLIAQENPKKPLSDQSLQTLLAEEGHQLARRTITKYRESLNIPASSQRRLHN